MLQTVTFAVRSRAAVARRAHNPKVTGSIPVFATYLCNLLLFSKLHYFFNHPYKYFIGINVNYTGVVFKMKILKHTSMIKKNFFKIYPLSRRLDKRWFVIYTPPTNHSFGYKKLKLYGDINSYSTSFERMKAANELIKKINKLQYNTVEDIPEPLHPLLELVNKIPLRQSSKRAYVQKVHFFIKWLKKDKPNELTGINFIEHLHAIKKSPTTVNTYRQALKQVFTIAIKTKLYNIKNPFELTKKIKTFPQGKMYFNEYQQSKLKYEIELHPQLWLGVQLQYYCFVRNGVEMTNLIIGDIDFTPGSEKILLRGEISKNKKTQFVAIPTQLLPKLYFLKQLNPNLYIFSKSGQPGTEKLSLKWFNHQHSLILKKLGIISTRLSFYSWKHTGIYMFIKSGGSLKQLQLQLRHHSLDQVNQYIRDFGLNDCGDIKNNFPNI